MQEKTETDVADVFEELSDSLSNNSKSTKPPNPPTSPSTTSNSSNVVILQPVDPTQIPKRRPGRPRTKISPKDIYPPPSSQPSSTSKSYEQTKEEYTREVRNLQNKIVKDFNEELLTVLVTVGVPAEMLFKSGRPTLATVDSNYTDLANSICINPLQANLIAHGIVEAKKVPFVQNHLMASKPESPSYLWLGLGLLGVVSWLNSLNEVRKLLMAMKAQIKAAEAAQAAEAEAAQGPTAPSFSEA